MGEFFGLFFLIATSLLGIIGILEQLFVSWLKGNEKLSESVTITLEHDAVDAEFLLRRYIWLGIDEIRIIDGGMDDATKDVVNRFAMRHRLVVVE